ncbi:MAG TPA: hypothetical protein VM287_09440 [Egibacteraceae bacterium]|nr:hypothetical protein [Egibacteraceae bacterium]
MVERTDEPLAAGQDLERLAALLEELDRVGYRSRVSEQVARLAEQLDDALARRLHLLAGQLAPRRRRLDALGRLGLDAAVAPDDRADRELQLTPPLDVGDVTERADHGDPGALLRLGQPVGQDRHPDAEQGRDRLRAEQRLVPLVVGMGDEGDARRDQLRPGGVDLDARAVRPAEADVVVGARQLAVLQLGLGDGGLEVDVPQRGGHRLVCLTLGQQAQEPPLGRPLSLGADRRVGHAPVDGQAEVAPQLFEGLLVLDGQADAQLDEVGPGDGDGS